MSKIVTSGLWSKVGQPEPQQTPKKKESAKDKIHVAPRALWWGLDTLSLITWSYIITKLLLFDFDRSFIDRYWPAGEWLLDYKFVVVLSILALLALLKRKWFFLTLFYVMTWPLIVAFWKFPKLLYRRKKWILPLAAANLLTSFAKSYRFILIGVATFVVSTVLVLANANRQIQGFSAGAIFLLLIISYWRNISRSLKSASFISMQEGIIRRIMAWEIFNSTWKLDAELRSEDIEKYDSNQLTMFTTKLAQGVLYHRVIYYWAYQLELYRRSPSPLLLNAVSYIRLFLQTWLTYSIVNICIYNIDSTQYEFTKAPSNLQFLNYTLSSMYSGETSLLTAAGEWALLLRILTVVTGVLFLTTLALTLILNVRASRERQALAEVIKSIKRSGQKFEDEFRTIYEISISDAIERLATLSATLLKMIVFLSDRIPPEFENEE